MHTTRTASQQSPYLSSSPSTTPPHGALSRRALARTRALALTLALTVAATASAGAGLLGPGDETLSTGEYYDRVTFQGAAGDRVTIELSSTDFDPFLIILNANDQPLLQEDDSPGAGLNVNLTYQLPAAGTYTIVVTSALPGEAGGYRLTLAAVGQGAGPANAGTPPAPIPAPTPAPTPAPAPPTPRTAQPGTVTGTVVDTQGRPLAGARVWIQPAITTGVVEVRTDNQGRYLASSLIDVPYTAKAWAYIDYGGRTLCLRMGMDSPVDYDAFVPSQGAVKNFHWQLTGPIEDLRSLNEYYGGMLRVMYTNMYGGGGNRIEFTFTPTGPRIDGSSVAPFTRTIDPARDYDIYDLPVGPYRVSAQLVGGDGSRRPLRLAADSFETAQDSIAIDWTGDGSCSNSNGLGWAYAWLEIPE